MDCGYEFLYDAKVVMDDIGQGSQAIGGVGRIADSLEGVFILVTVHTYHKHGGSCQRGRDGDPLGCSFLQVSEDTSGLHNIFSNSIAPSDFGEISLLEDADGLSTDVKFPILSLDCAFQLAMSRFILNM